jgi:hypothetical protein
MYYTQVLRVARSLKWLGICLGVIYGLCFLTLALNGVLGKQSQGSSDLIPLPALFAIAAFFAAGIGSRFARSFSEENEAHLPVAWTKPVSRVRYALTEVAVDTVGILAAFALTLLSMVVAIGLVGALRSIEVTPDWGIQLLRFLALPFGFYGLIVAATASLGKSGRGAVWYIWLGAFVISGLSAFAFPKPWGPIFAALDLINPLHYAGYSHTVGQNTVNIMGPTSVANAVSVGVDIVGLAALFAIGFAAGVWQWRRLEA